jgi:alpha-ketoglutarate-dependent taurine dioxygenase
VQAVCARDMHWHSDLRINRPPRRRRCSMASNACRKAANEFINMNAAYAALPVERRMFWTNCARCTIVIIALRAQPQPYGAYAGTDGKALHSEHPLVRVHPVTGRKALFVAKDVVSHISWFRAGREPQADRRAGVFATQPRFVYSHQLAGW